MSLLDLSLLGLLADQPLHGYELSKRLRELGRGAVSFGALYPALGRLDRKGLITAATAAPQSATPMTGSLGAEVARLRRGAPSTSSRSGRKRKVYTITATGSTMLHDLLVEPAEDDRTFAVQLAFATNMSADERLEVFRRRQSALHKRLAAESPGRLDRYRRALHERDRLADEAELAWLGELITTERDRQTAESDVDQIVDAASSIDTSVDQIPETVGGSPK